VLADAGIAMLAYDKPDAWTGQSFHDRATEALAALGVLRAEPSTGPVGFLGGSQGGWIAPIAAAQSSDVDFIVCASASGVGPREQDLYRVEHQLRADGFEEGQIAAALALWHERDEGLRRGDRPESVLALGETHRDEPWARYLALDDADQLAFGQRIWDFDVVPYLERCRCRVLAVWGESDPIVAAHESKRIFERALREAGNTNFELVLVPGADHGLRGGAVERADVIRLVADWILTAAVSS